MPHMLTAKHKNQRVQLAKDLFKIIAAARRDSWSYFTAGGESWFYLSTDYETIWLQEGEDLLRRCIELDGEYVY
jgi:hypothetical protein